MMKREKDVISLPIMDKNLGNKIASIRDVIYSKNKFRILAFLVADGGIFSNAKIIKFKNIDSFGTDAIMIKNESVLENADLFPEIQELLDEKRKINGEEVLTEDGDSMGSVYDTIFDEDNGRVLGFILTDGVIEDLKEGRNILPYINGMTFGEKALIIPNQIKNQFEKNKETFKNLLELH